MSRRSLSAAMPRLRLTPEGRQRLLAIVSVSQGAEGVEHIEALELN